MSITVEGVGSLSTHADSITPSFPAGDPTAGRLAILVVASGHPDESDATSTSIEPFTPPGWELVGTVAGADSNDPTGVYGEDDGPRRLTFFARELDGSDQDPTTFITSGSSGSVISGRIVTFSRSSGSIWRYVASMGVAGNHSTNITADGGTDVNFSTDDVCLIGFAMNTDAAELSSQTLTASDVTFGSYTEEFDDAVTTGDDLRICGVTVPVTDGDGDPQTVQFDATLASAGSGPYGLVRVREEPESSISVSEQTVFPPRVQISVSGMLGEQIESVTVYRDVDGDRSVVRSLSEVDTIGLDAAVRVDGEFPFGKAITYVAEYTDVGGLIYEQESSPITVNVDNVVISDAILGIGLETKIFEWAEKQHDRDYSKFVVGGRVVIVAAGDRQLPSSTLTLRVDTNAERKDLENLLQNATSGVILIRQPGQFEDIDAYLAVLSDKNVRLNPKSALEPKRFWELEVQEVLPWTDNLEAAGFSLQDIADNYEGNILSAIETDFPGTLLDISVHDWGS